MGSEFVQSLEVLLSVGRIPEEEKQFSKRTAGSTCSQAHRCLPLRLEQHGILLLRGKMPQSGVQSLCSSVLPLRVHNTGYPREEDRVLEGQGESNMHSLNTMTLEACVLVCLGE